MKKIIMTSTLAMSVILAGCASTGSTTASTNSTPAVNTDTAKNVGIGALAGGVLGAVVSKATGGKETGRDAAIGAAIGAGIGAYMSRQEAKLKEQTAGTGIEVQRDPVTNNINLVIPEAITFDRAQYAIKTNSHTTLSKVASTLKEYGETTVVVNGYASAEGNPNFNKTLSENRAIAVANYLVNNGVNAQRITAYGHGATTQFGSSYEANRRVELSIIAPKSLNQ